ncbi:hypothetical protein [Bradyrhizobium diazoefficiens]
MRKRTVLLAMIFTGGIAPARELERICRDDSIGIWVRYDEAENFSRIDCLIPRMRQPVPNTYTNIRLPGKCHAVGSIPGGHVTVSSDGGELCDGNVGEWKCRVECD